MSEGEGRPNQPQIAKLAGTVCATSGEDMLIRIEAPIGTSTLRSSPPDESLINRMS